MTRIINVVGSIEHRRRTLVDDLRRALTNAGETVTLLDYGDARPAPVISWETFRDLGATVAIVTGCSASQPVFLEADLLWDKLPAVDMLVALTRIEDEADRAIQQLVRLAPPDCVYHVWALRSQMHGALWLAEIDKDFTAALASTRAQIAQLVEAWGHDKPKPLSVDEAEQLQQLLVRAIAHKQIKIPKLYGGRVAADIPLANATLKGPAVVQLITSAFARAQPKDCE